eukprot:704041-Pelagomonas_calceolata.AAC.5
MEIDMHQGHFLSCHIGRGVAQSVCMGAWTVEEEVSGPVMGLTKMPLNIQGLTHGRLLVQLVVHLLLKRWVS